MYFAAVLDLIMLLLGILLIVYYIVIVGQIFGFWKTIPYVIKFPTMLIPFWYWLK